VSLEKRGPGVAQLMPSDDHAGLRVARVAVVGGLPWQRCQFHLQQNVQADVSSKDMPTAVAGDLRMIFEAPDRATAEASLAKTVAKYKQSASRLSEWRVTNLLEGLTYFASPNAFRKLLRTSALLTHSGVLSVVIATSNRSKQKEEPPNFEGGSLAFRQHALMLGNFALFSGKIAGFLWS
jgi:transposase-like protein